MSQLSKNPANPQAARYPVVSYRLQLQIGARRVALRRNVPPAAQPAVLAAVDQAYRNTHGNRFAARRAGWQAVDRVVAMGAGA